MPPFSVTLTRCVPGQGPVEVLALQDWRSANKRELYLDLQPNDDNPWAETAQFAGSIAYDVEYLDAKREVAHHHELNSSITSAPSTSTFSLSTGGEGNPIYSTSTAEADLDHEFEREDGTDNNSDGGRATPSDCDVDDNPPPHCRAALLTSLLHAPSLPPRLRRFSMNAANAGVASVSPSILSSSPSDEYENDAVSSMPTAELDPNGEFEAVHSSGSEITTPPEGEVEDSGPVPPLHRQLAPPNPLVQVPPPPHPRYHDAIPMRLLDTRGPRVYSEGPGLPTRGSSSRRFTGWSLLAHFFNIFRSLWRRLKRIGGVVLREATKDL